MENLRLKYQIVNENIRFVKQQQWNTIYYTLTAIGGIVALTLGLPKVYMQIFIKWFLIVISSIVSFSGIYFIWNHQTTLKEYRVEKEDIRDKLFSEKKVKQSDKEFAIIFTIIIFLVWLLEIYLILNSN